jgi:hypothetical protein
MALPIRMEATVSGEGTIELHVPELRPGQHVSVTIEEGPQEPPTSGVHIIDLIKDLPGHQLFRTAEDVDEYLRQERESWER